MRAALADAGLADEGAIGYLNLHATATARVFPRGVPCSGTKPLTGHTLGAAAATELAFAWLTLNPAWNPEARLPPHRWDGEADSSFPSLSLVEKGAPFLGPRICMSNAFAFGGNNLSLVIGETP